MIETKKVENSVSLSLLSYSTTSYQYAKNKQLLGPAVKSERSEDQFKAYIR
jgi:hypothetical protein